MSDNKNIIGTSSKVHKEDELNYLIDSILVRTETRTIYEILRRINQQKPNQTKIILNPDFPRGFVWDIFTQSKLIESCLMHLPLPGFYFAEQENGDMVIVDGLQRLTTLKRYLSNEFALQKSALGNLLEGKKFEDLSPQLQNRLEDTPLILYLIDYKVPEPAKLEIFERVNSGKLLSYQQMRHVL